jgi:hypothetical protein
MGIDTPKLIVFLILAVIVLVQTSRGQSQQHDVYGELRRKLTETASLDEIKDATSEAKRINKSLIAKSNNDPAQTADAMVDLAVFRRYVFGRLKNKQNDLTKNDSALLLRLLNFLDENAKAIESLLNDSIKTYEQNLHKESAKLGQAKFELGWFLENHQPFKFGPLSNTEKRRRLQTAQQAYSQALAIQQKLLGNWNPSTLVTQLSLANSLVADSEFERAQPLFRSYFTNVSAVEGENSPALLPAAKMLLALAEMRGDETEATRYRETVFKLAGKNEDTGENLFVLTSRVLDQDAKGISERVGDVRLGREFTSPDGSSLKLSSNNRLSSAPKLAVDGKAQFGSGIPVFVNIDEGGNVVEAIGHSPNAKQNKRIESQVKKWTFRPLTFEGRPSKMKGIVYYWEVN